MISGIGVEKIFPIHSPAIEKIEILKRSKVRRAKLYYLRKAKGKKAKLKRKEFVEAIAEPASTEAAADKKEATPSAETSEDKEEKIAEEKPLGEAKEEEKNK